MLRLSKRVEYGLIALRHIAMHPRGQIFTVKEIAEMYDLPYELLAKVMQRMAKSGLIQSQQGVKGGYILVRNADEIRISMVIQSIDNEKPMIAECYADGPDSCYLFDNCTIRKPLAKIQRNINDVFNKMTVLEIV